MSDEPVRPDPADMVPPGERAALADKARDLVGERADLAHTAHDLIGERAGLADTARELVGERATLADVATKLVESNAALANRVQTLQDVLDEEQRIRAATQRKHWLAIVWNYVVNALHILVTVAAVLFGAGYVQAQDQIAILVAKLDRSVHSQCGTLNLLIKSYRGTPPPGSPINPQEYRDSYIDIQRQADGVPCGIKHVVPGT